VELKDWRTALREAGEDTIDMDLYVEPGASTTAFGPYDPWRQRIKVKVKAPATGGRANEELIGAISDLLDVPRKAVHIARGATTRRKTLRVSGVSSAAAEEAISSVLVEEAGPG
jgi:uncharacterized protein (TIGR00251 family)